MGLLNFTKKSKKQQAQTAATSVFQPFALSHHLPSQEEKNKNDYFSTTTTTKDFNFESSGPKDSGTSLMDDIMNELDSARSITSVNYYKQTNTTTNQGT